MSELLQAFLFLYKQRLGKVQTQLELHKLIKKACHNNESEILSPKECSDLLEILISSYIFKIGESINRKVEQSLISARANGELTMTHLVTIAQLLSFGQEGESSFWAFFEECIGLNIEGLTDHQFLIVMQIF